MRYKKPGTSALSQAAAEILEGLSRVNLVSAMSPQQPTDLLAALLGEARRQEKEVHLFVADLSAKFEFLGRDDVRDLQAGRLRITMLAGGAPRHLAHLVDSLPISLWETDRFLADGTLPCDIYAVRLTQGVSGIELGNSVAFTPTLATRAGVRLIAEVAPLGESVDGLAPAPPEWWKDAVLVHVNKRTAPSNCSKPPSDPVRSEIAKFISKLVPHHATLEVGIGGLADAVVHAVGNRPRMGIHSGVLSPTLRSYISQGSFTACAKSIHEGMNIGTSLAANAGNLPWPTQVELRPVSETHNPELLAQHEHFWAVNSAFAVDLSGQINAEWIGGVKVAVGGGQQDFARAGHRSKGGASVIAIPSQTSQGESRIVSNHGLIAPITTTASDVDFVVTEWGIADLRGKTLGDRARSLVAVAHPQHRRLLCESTP